MFEKVRGCFVKSSHFVNEVAASQNISFGAFSKVISNLQLQVNERLNDNEVDLCDFKNNYYLLIRGCQAFSVSNMSYVLYSSSNKLFYLKPLNDHFAAFIRIRLYRGCRPRQLGVCAWVYDSKCLRLTLSLSLS